MTTTVLAERVLYILGFLANFFIVKPFIFGKLVYDKCMNFLQSFGASMVMPGDVSPWNVFLVTLTSLCSFELCISILN